MTFQQNKIQLISDQIVFQPYIVDSVTLLTGNAVLTTCDKIKSWKLT